jgi:hypothetical protein
MARTTATSPTGKQTPSRRVLREQRTLDVMIRMYCTAHHAESPSSDQVPSRSAAAAETPVCEECASLVVYALDRIENCRFGDDKPTCAKCPVHCFRPAMREPIRIVMRYAGPRMTLRHPYLAVRHLLDGKTIPSGS